MTESGETRVLDIGPLFTSPQASPGLDQAVAATLRDEGAFLAAGFPGSEGLERRVGLLLSFFALPEAVRSPLAVRKHRDASTNVYRGYYPPPREPHWSYNEIFDIGPEPPLGAPDLRGAAAFREANVWPPEGALPGWRQAMLDYAATCRAVALAVVAAAVRGLGLDPAPATGICAGRNGTLRLLHYPPIPAAFALRGRDGEAVAREAEGRRVIARPHVDTGLLSVLWQSDGGLQMRGSGGTWRAVPTEPGTLSIHCGDLLAGLSEAALRGTTHRVLGDGAERFSIGYFLEPEFSAEIRPPQGAATKSYAAHLIDEFPTRFDPEAQSLAS